MCINQMIEISKGLLTPIIAVIATYIAWQQWKVNKQKLKLELYDRRLAIYEEVMQILSIILRDADASFDDLLKYRTSVSEADFLFEQEIPFYIDEIYQRGIKLHKLNKQCNESKEKNTDGFKDAEIMEKVGKELEWLTKQFDPAKEKFKQYLEISK